MTFEDNCNHFCIYCGAKIDSGQNFCIKCGKPVFREEKLNEVVKPRYVKIIDDLDSEYNVKQTKANELVEKLFDPGHMSYDKFTSLITKSNQLFYNQLQIARRMVELDWDNNELLEREIDNKIKTLQAFIDKMENLMDELVIHLSSNKKDNDDINNLFKDMDDLIRSVKDY